MRPAVLSALALGLAACASAPPVEAPPSPATTSAGTWTFAFDAGPGLASAILHAADGRPLLRVTCEAPRGDLQVTDWTFSRARQGEAQATVSVADQGAVTAGRIAGDGAGRQALTFALSPRDPVFGALTPSASVRTAAAGYTHTWAQGAATRLNDVINACRTMGS